MHMFNPGRTPDDSGGEDRCPDEVRRGEQEAPAGESQAAGDVLERLQEQEQVR